MLKKIFFSSCLLFIFIGSSEAADAKPEADRLVYVGRDFDKTKSGSENRSDGIKDMHFQITHDFGKGTELVGVAVSRVQDDKSFQGAAWDTDGGYWVLAVEANNKPLNVAKAKSLGKLSGKVKLDLFGAFNAGLADRGQTYQADIKVIENGRERILSSRTTLK